MSRRDLKRYSRGAVDILSPRPRSRDFYATETGPVRSITIPSQTNQMMRPNPETAMRTSEARTTERMPATPSITPT
jgi:hypothetical protein